MSLPQPGIQCHQVSAWLMWWAAAGRGTLNQDMTLNLNFSFHTVRNRYVFPDKRKHTSLLTLRYRSVRPPPAPNSQQVASLKSGCFSSAMITWMLWLLRTCGIAPLVSHQLSSQHQHPKTQSRARVLRTLGPQDSQLNPT